MAKVPGIQNDGDNLLAAALMLFQGETITKRVLMKRLQVSRATAQRYIVRLERLLPVHVELQACAGFTRPRKALHMRLMPMSTNGC